ncbi:MAG: alkaline phosphatase [Parcubacteria group bacterium]|nr:MAG: alkaline phosphatase [Parcubacteria group bacterium]
MITNLIDFLAQLVVNIISHIGYCGIFLLMLVESCGIPMPSEVIMPFSGFLVVDGQLNFLAVVIIGTIGNLAGSILAYWIGAKGGRLLLEKYGKYILISRHDLSLADRLFARWGQAVVFFGRLLPVVRTYISFPAGIARMNFKKFCLYTFLGALPWSILFVWLGVKMGSHWDLIREKLHDFDMAMLALVILAILFYIWRHWQNRKISN